ncbi:MAG: right-handed parallel beta-helix repeat-containing protein [Solirubrobacteraceae bacterium]
MLAGYNAGHTVIRNLTFRNGGNGENSGGAINLVGDSPVSIEGNRFLANTAGFGSGGAVYIADYPLFFGEQRACVRDGSTRDVVLRGNVFGGPGDGQPNAADRDGGAVYIQAADPVTLEGNTFTGNVAAGRGGGAYVTACSALDVNDNTFRANRLADHPVTPEFANDDRYGAGLALDACRQEIPTLAARARAASEDPQLQQSGNVFDANAIEGTIGDVSGAGEWVQNLQARSVDDRFTRNTVAAGPTIDEGDDAEGAGLSVNYFRFGSGAFEGRNLVAAGNAFDTGGEGGGIYVGAPQGALLTLFDSTVAGNTAQSAGGISGGPADHLELRNAIVPVNKGDGQLGGFAAGGVDAASSLLCGPGVPADGSRDTHANFCADPLLVDPRGGEVHETANSPSRNTGDDSLVPADLAKDYEGDARIGEGRVDIGADEYVATTKPAPPAAASTPAPAQGISPVTIRRCVSRRGFRIRLRVPHGQKGSGAVVHVVSSKVRVTVRHKRLTAPVVLRGLPKGTFSVKIRIHLANGRTIAGTRIYHTCTIKRTGSIPTV